MEDSELKVILGILYDHVRHLHVKLHQMELIALSAKDTLAVLNQTRQAEALYKQIYKKHDDENKAAFDQALAAIDRELKDLEPPSSGTVH